MGKYKNSDLHNEYSDWHWNLTKLDDKYKKLYVSDLDRLWCEYDYKGNTIVGVQDIKTIKESGYCMNLSPTEYRVYKWFLEKGSRVDIVYISDDFERFTIREFRTDKSDRFYTLDGAEAYADWLLELRKGDAAASEYLKRRM